MQLCSRSSMLALLLATACMGDGKQRHCQAHIHLSVVPLISLIPENQLILQLVQKPPKPAKTAAARTEIPVCKLEKKVFPLGLRLSEQLPLRADRLVKTQAPCWFMFCQDSVVTVRPEVKAPTFPSAGPQ